MEKCLCLKCGHEWYKRTERKPMECPACKSRYWDKRPAIREGEDRYDVSSVRIRDNDANR